MHRCTALLLLAACGSSPSVTEPTADPTPETEPTSATGAEITAEVALPTSAELPCSEGGTVSDLSVGPSGVCAVVDGRVVCLGSGDREPKGLRAVAGPPNLRRLSTNGRRIFAIDTDGRLWRWKEDDDFRDPEVIGRAVDVVVGSADGSKDPLCVLTEDGEARCQLLRDRSELGDPDFRVPGALEIQVRGRYYCVRTESELRCQPTHDFGDPPVTLNAEGATGLYWDYADGCVLHPSGPRCTEGYDSGQVFGSAIPARALSGWTDARWGTCLVAGGATQCRMGNGWQRTTTFAGTPTALGMGKELACALCGSTVSCWGEMETLGDLGGEVYAGPKRIEGLSGVTAIYAGSGPLGEGYCAETGEGLHCWGAAAEGVRDLPEAVDGLRRSDLEPKGSCTLEEGRVSCEDAPFRVAGALQLVQSSRNRCARTEDAVVCSVDERDPIRMPVRARDIAMHGSGDVCAVTEGGELQCTNIGPYGGLLTGRFWDRSEGLHPIEGITDAVDVALTQWAICVLHEDEHVSCFGSRLANRLHDGGTFAERPVVIDFTAVE